MLMYELVGEYLEFANSIDINSSEDELSSALDKLDKLQEPIKDKIRAVAKIITSHSAMAAAIRAEEKKLAYRRRALEKSIDRTKEWLMQSMEAANLAQVDSPSVPVKIVKSPWSVNTDMLDISKIPSQYVKTSVIHEFDKNKILNDFKNGTLDSIYSCAIYRKNRLQIGYPRSGESSENEDV